ncbi:MAG: hypothetical protein ABMB14_38155, partial [Myxococcota bacterium]
MNPDTRRSAPGPTGIARNEIWDPSSTTSGSPAGTTAASSSHGPRTHRTSSRSTGWTTRRLISSNSLSPFHD